MGAKNEWWKSSGSSCRVSAAPGRAAVLPRMTTRGWSVAESCSARSMSHNSSMTLSMGADEKLKSYEQTLDAARQQGLELRKQMRAEGAGEEQQIMSAAGKEVAATMKAAQEAIAAQVNGAKNALSADVEKFALKATAKILGQA